MNARMGLARGVILGLVAVGTLAALAGGADERLQVQVREAPVRQRAEALAPITGTLRYADRVVVQERLKNGWVRVASVEGGVTGYLRESALAKKVAPLQAGEGAASVSAEDVSLAGKGLKDSVDRYITRNNLEAAAAKLDEIERRSYTELTLEQVGEFRAAGGLGAGEGR